jgi:hypothetical protein
VNAIPNQSRFIRIVSIGSNLETCILNPASPRLDIE